MNETLASAEHAGSHDALAAAATPLPSTLCAERRLALGITIEDVANQLKFAPRQIEALEAGEFDRLPGGTFARGMIRSYTRLLKLEPEPLLAQLAASGIGPQAGPEEAVSLRAPIPFSEGGRHGNLIYTVLSVVLLAVVAFFAFESLQDKDGSTMAFVTPGQERAAQPAGVTPQPSTETAAPAVTAAPLTPVAKAAEKATRPDTVASAGPAPLPETAPSKNESLAPVAAGKRRIVMRFDKDAWVQIKARNGVTLLSELNPAGSERVIDGEPPFQLTIGNAPNVHLIYNDQPVDLKQHYKVDVARLTLN